MRQPVAIVCAMEVEAKAVRQELRHRNLALKLNADILSLVTVVVIGPGAAQMGKALGKGIARVLVVAGVGGGLAEDLKLGDVIVDRRTQGWTPPPGTRSGRIVSATGVVSSPAEKKKLREISKADVVDMETERVRDHADDLTRVIGVRSILDTAAEVLPPWLEHLVTDAGTTSLLGVAGALARNPTRITTLLRLGKSSKVANQAFAKVAVDLALLIYTDALRANIPPPPVITF